MEIYVGDSLAAEISDGRLDMEFAKEILEGLDYEINESSFTIRPLHTDEQKYTYKQSTQIEGQTGNIGYLRGDFGAGGRVMGSKMVDSGNIKDCLYSDTDMTEWYVDRYGDLRADAVHHDGTNHYLYRVFKDTASPEQIERLQEKIYYGKATRADITRVTKRLGDEIAAVYGFHIPKQRTAMEQAR